MILYTLLFFVYVVNAGETHARGTATDSFKDQFCTDPRTMRKHAAYSEWADAYSCTRHRCQPGGRNLAIYTVGCKRVEAPESAIECEEVVEDTNMQFPYCCTRLRCLVVVRGEVWTRVLGQPWETLPAAPWSHMYKMKKPPPVDGAFLPKTADGPIYELTSDTENSARDNILRSGKKMTTVGPDCNHVESRPGPTPDIVIALSTDGKERKKDSSSYRYGVKRVRKTTQSPQHHEDVGDRNDLDAIDIEEPIGPTEKPPDMASDERFYGKSFGVTKKQSYKNRQTWTEIPQSQWNEPAMDIERKDTNYHQQDILSPMTQQDLGKKDEKPSNLQALVDAIGTRMRDIENVVQKMSEKVHQKPGDELTSSEKRSFSENEVSLKHHMGELKEHGLEKKSNNDEQYKRFSIRNLGSQYLHSAPDGTTDLPSEDNGYFSDASNTMDRRSNLVNPPKEPQTQMYMAPVDTRRKAQHVNSMTASEEIEKKKEHKKRIHKKKKTKGRGHKKRRNKEDKRKRDKLSSVELEKNIASLEDTSAMGETSVNENSEHSAQPTEQASV